MKKACSFILAALFLISSTRVSIAARALSIVADKASLFGEEEAIITASPSGFTSGETIYIKGAFYQEGSTNYFGYTKKEDGSWVKNGETTTSQRQIVIDSWDGKLSIKSDFLDSGYQGEGDYKLKVGFYYTTSGGNLSSVNWSTDTLTITLNEPDPTPTPTPTPTPAPTQAPTVAPTPTPTKTPSPTPTKTPTSTPSQTSTSESEENLTENTTLSPTPTPETAVLGESVSKKGSIFPYLLIVSGIICLGVGGYFLYNRRSEET